MCIRDRAKAVRYILNIIPPDPTTFHPKDMMGLIDMARHFLGCLLYTSRCV